MRKKILCLLFIITLIFSLCSCQAGVRIDFSELLKRVEKKQELTECRIQDAVVSDGEWFLFLSLENENDILINAVEDENKSLISASVSTVNASDKNTEEGFMILCKAVAEAFITGESVDMMLNEVGFYDDGVIFSDHVGFYESGRYKISFFNADIGSTLLIELVY